LARDVCEAEIEVRRRIWLVVDGNIEAYKGVLADGKSKYMPHRFKYEVGKTYSNPTCDSSSGNNSFGLSAWNLREASKYCPFKVLIVRIDPKDIGTITAEGKIRCFKLTIVGVVDKEKVYFSLFHHVPYHDKNYLECLPPRHAEEARKLGL
jgi:hypothetical protein